MDNTTGSNSKIFHRVDSCFASILIFQNNGIACVKVAGVSVNTKARASLQDMFY
jgi:hypothetical protein